MASENKTHVTPPSSLGRNLFGPVSDFFFLFRERDGMSQAESTAESNLDLLSRSQWIQLNFSLKSKDADSIEVPDLEFN